MIYIPRHITYYPDNRTQENKMVGYVTRLGVNKNGYRILVEKQKGKRPLGRPKHRWENNIERDKKQDGRVWTGLILLKKGTMVGRSECGNKTSGSVLSE